MGIVKVYSLSLYAVGMASIMRMDIREQGYYSNGLQDVVTSIYLVKIKANICKTSWIRTHTSLQSYAMPTELLVIRCKQLFD